jgi:uncharacterized membrane protein YfhO
VSFQVITGVLTAAIASKHLDLVATSMYIYLFIMVQELLSAKNAKKLLFANIIYRTIWPLIKVKNSLNAKFAVKSFQERIN